MRKFSYLLVIAVILSMTVSFMPVFVSAQNEVTEPVPNKIQLSISETGVVSNGVTGGVPLVKADEAVAPETKIDVATGNPYLALDANVPNGFYKADMMDYFWKYWHNIKSSESNDLSFTWEFNIMLPEMPANETHVLGYLADSGFGLRVNATKGFLIIGHDMTDSGNPVGGAEAEIVFQFDMTAKKWYHCVLTYNHSTRIANVYVNGTPVLDANGNTDVTVSDIVPVPYIWNRGGMCIGGGSTELDAVQVSHNIGICNFSDYAVTKTQFAALYSAYMKNWGSAPIPNAFQMEIAEDGTVSNKVDSNIYQLSGTTIIPDTAVDTLSGNSYVQFSTDDNAFYQVSMFQGSTGFFWDYYNNEKSDQDNDLSFTWEILFMMPELVADPVGAGVFGYRADNAGFGLNVSNTQGKLVLGEGSTSDIYNGDSLIEFCFPMEANKWYHCVLTYNHRTKTASAYVNGEAIETPDGNSSVILEHFVATHYLWHAAGMGIGTTPEKADANQVTFASNIGVYNFSTYSVSGEEALLLWENVEDSWNLTDTTQDSGDDDQDEDLDSNPDNNQSGTVTPPPTGDNQLIFCVVLVLCGVCAWFTICRRKLLEK